MLILSFAGLTLLELLIALVLLSLIVLGFMNFDLFTHNQVVTAGARGNLQNELSFVVEHINKNLVRAIGNEMANGNNTVVRIRDDRVDNITMSIYIDANGDGIRQDPVIHPGVNDDYYVGYRYFYAGPSRYNIVYCRRCPNRVCLQCPVPEETLTIRINSLDNRGAGRDPFTKPDPVGALNDNFINIELSACWDPSGTKGRCGSGNNPQQIIRTRMNMPMVTYR